ncbi:capsid protein [Sporosarcina sp. P37]|uniref:phage major capsid protein n=1 Tax=unclassified Sporosarcina TaxID=2647733 RepID=UPI000A17F200|nr:MULTISPECIES: phage major capsid protein [unclassified Sporosarcina]ARK23578.1 capsid protein [Sporosarcina sp. P37]PID18800.1 phage major capsid protein [Sporosarcina sp. P35]
MTTGMKNPDKQTPVINKEEQIKALKMAFENGDSAEVAARIVENYEANAQQYQAMMDQTIAEAKRAQEEGWDQATLNARGIRTLTTAEKKFYNQAIEVQSFDGVAALVPPTVFDRIFEDLATEHPLLSRINMQTTGAATMWVTRKEGATTAFWGDVCDEIKEMVDNGFETVDMGMQKLSGFLVVCKAMFELGPEWLDRYVRTLLTEIMATELESVAVNGDGNKKPIGMMRDLDGAVSGGVYPEKTPVALPDFSPATIGESILAPTTKGGTRTYTGVTLIVNPLDYASKFFAIGAKQKDDGTWTFNNFAVPGLEIIQTPAVPIGKVVAGKPKDYFMGVGSAAKLESTDVLRMIEDQRLYLVRQLINGRPLDNEAFTVFDIADMSLTPVEGVPVP